MRYVLIIASAVAATVTFIATPATSSAHPGGLNGEGCHNNRRTRDYHCHRGSSPRRSSAAVAARRGGGAYANCSAARAAGAAPVRRGQAGYGTHLDRDGDGVGCE